MPTKKGFTLIELLLAITILSIIAGIISYSLSGQQRKARDASRKNDLAQLKRAMESAKNDCHAASYYPIAPGTDPANTFSLTAYYYKIYKLLDTQIVDPKNSGTYIYTLHHSSTLTEGVCPDNSQNQEQEGTRVYVARAKLEIAEDPEANKTRISCADAISRVDPASFTPAPAANDGYYYVCPD